MNYALHQHNKDVGTANNMESDNYYKDQDNTETCYTHTHYDNAYVHITIGDELWCGLAGHQKILVPFLSQNFKFNLASLSHPYGFVKKGMYHCNIDLEYC